MSSSNRKGKQPAKQYPVKDLQTFFRKLLRNSRSPSPPRDGAGPSRSRPRSRSPRRTYGDLPEEIVEQILAYRPGSPKERARMMIETGSRIPRAMGMSPRSYLRNLQVEDEIQIYNKKQQENSWYFSPLDMSDLQYGNLKDILMSAIRYGLPNIVKYVLDNGANPNVQYDYDDISPLEQAIKSYFTRYDDDEEDSYQRTLKIMKYLLDAGANVNYLSHEGTALTEAVKTKYPELVKMLLKRGADPNVSPLIIHKINYKNPEIVQALINAGIDLSMRSWIGKTVLDEARKILKEAWDPSEKPKIEQSVRIIEKALER